MAVLVEAGAKNIRQYGGRAGRAKSGVLINVNSRTYATGKHRV